MEELKRRKVSRNDKMMTALTAPHIRSLIDRANELEIPREDVITVIDKKDEIVLIYYS